MNEHDESAFLYHQPCPACGSSDGLAVYDSGSGYCFVCFTYYRNLFDDEPPTPSKQPMSKITVEGEAVRLAKRKLSAETCTKFKCTRDGDLLRFYYYDDAKNIVGCKVKTLDKKFRYSGQATDCLYGRQLWPSTGKRVVITEGELDAMSYAEVQPSWPVVSLPHGAASAAKAMKANLEWLQGYDEIVLAFDNDEAGRKAADAASAVLPMGKVKRAVLPDVYKDFSDALMANDIEAIKKAVWNSEQHKPDGIIDAQTLLSELLTPKQDSLYEYSFQGLQQYLDGIRERELITLTGGTGMGKSSLARRLASDVLKDGGRVGYLALEEHYITTLRGLIGTSIGRNLISGTYTPEEMMEFYDQTVAKWNLQLFDGFGSYSPDEIYKRIEYMVLGLGCKVIFLDHLSILLSGLQLDDERRAIDITMTNLRSLVEETGATLFLLCHLTGDDGGKPYEEGGRVKLNKLRGSRSIAQLSNCVIAVEGDQQDEELSNRRAVRVLKNRHNGKTGLACYLDYGIQTDGFTEVHSVFPTAATTTTTTTKHKLEPEF